MGCNDWFGHPAENRNFETDLIFPSSKSFISYFRCGDYHPQAVRRCRIMEALLTISVITAISMASCCPSKLPGICLGAVVPAPCRLAGRLPGYQVTFLAGPSIMVYTSGGMNIWNKHEVYQNRSSIEKKTTSYLPSTGRNQVIKDKFMWADD